MTYTCGIRMTILLCVLATVPLVVPAPQPFIAVDRIVDESYAVLLLGDEEKEVIVQLTTRCNARQPKRAWPARLIRWQQLASTVRGGRSFRIDRKRQLLLERGSALAETKREHADP